MTGVKSVNGENLILDNESTANQEIIRARFYDDPLLLGMMRCGVCYYINKKTEFEDKALDFFKRQKVSSRKKYVCPNCGSHKQFIVYVEEEFLASEN